MLAEFLGATTFQPAEKHPKAPSAQKGMRESFTPRSIGNERIKSKPLYTVPHSNHRCYMAGSCWYCCWIIYCSHSAVVTVGHSGTSRTRTPKHVDFFGELGLGAFRVVVWVLVCLFNLWLEYSGGEYSSVRARAPRDSNLQVNQAASALQRSRCPI